jgi:hypothetical protein
MPPAVVYFESDFQVQAYHQRDEWPTGENWDEELVVPGGLVYVGQGQTQFLRIDEVDPGMVWPKRRRRNRKKGTSPPPPPPPEPALAPSPAPIDWSDWEELCQAAPVPSPLPDPLPSPAWEPEDWDAEIAASQWEAEDVWQPEDWDAEIAASQWEPEDWDAELASQWQPEDWDAELPSQ